MNTLEVLFMFPENEKQKEIFISDFISRIQSKNDKEEVLKQIEFSIQVLNEIKESINLIVSDTICTHPKHPSFDESKCRTSNKDCSGCKYYQ